MTTNTSEPVQWWCGNDEETAPCQTGPNASFVSYTAGSAQGIAPITSSILSPSAIDTSTKPTTSFSSSSSTAVTSIDDTNTPTQDLHESTLGLSSTAKDDDAPISRSPTTAAISSALPGQPQSSNKLPTAIGVGIGVPLGIATVGFLGFLFTRQTNLKDKRKSIAIKNPSSRGGSGLQINNVDVNASSSSPIELRDDDLGRS